MSHQDSNDDSNSEEKPEALADDQLYTPALNEAQLTLRSVLAGCLVGSVTSCTNCYIGLKIGWAFGASIITAVLSFSLFAMFNRRLSILETNTAQTTGSAAGYMSTAAGLLAPIPALSMLGYEFHWYQLVMWAVAVGFLGVFFAVPLRRQLIMVDKLRFPTGTATAETILAMYSEASEAIAKARVLIICGAMAALFSLGSHFYPEIEEPPVHEWLGMASLAIAAAWGFKIYFGPSLLGAGFLIGPRVVLSILLGAVIGWGVLGPFAQSMGWVAGDIMDHKTIMDIKKGPRGWILWPGVALMVSESLMSLALSWKTFLRAFRFPPNTGNNSTTNAAVAEDHFIPNSWWIGGLIAGSCMTVLIAQFAFGIDWYLSLIAIALSSVLATVACRSLGETDINPVGGMGKVTQLAFAAVDPGQMSTNLLAAGITGGSASQAADMMSDLKTGHLLGASPRKQLLAQLVGICAGVLFCVPAYALLTEAYELGGDEMPAPAAMAWKAMAELLAEGPDALPPQSGAAVAIATCVGIVIAILRQIPSIKDYVPSGLAMGIGFIVHAYFSLVMFYGMAIGWVWKTISPSSAKKYTFAVASGLIAGEGLMGIVKAGLTILKIRTPGDIPQIPMKIMNLLESVIS